MIQQTTAAPSPAGRPSERYFGSPIGSGMEGPHQSMGRQLDRQGLERGQRLEPDVLAGEHVVSAIRSAGRVFLLCAGVAKMQQCSQVVIFPGISAPDILIVFPRKISLTRFCARRDGISVPRGDHLGRETAATPHSGLYADTKRTRNSIHTRNYLCVKGIQLFSC
jgi:hypothetical protein